MGISHWRGKIICIEGVDGAGKSTQVGRLEKFFKESGEEVVRVREPGGTKFGEKAREILLNDEEIKLSKVAEVLLFNAARSQLFHDVILPSVIDQKIVIMDRWAWSTIAYQGAEHENLEELDHIWNIAKLASYNHPPDMTLILDIPLKVMFDRMKGKKDKFESRGKPFFEGVREKYLQIAKHGPGRYGVHVRKLDADKSESEVFQGILNGLGIY